MALELPESAAREKFDNHSAFNLLFSPHVSLTHRFDQYTVDKLTFEDRFVRPDVGCATFLTLLDRLLYDLRDSGYDVRRRVSLGLDQVEAPVEERLDVRVSLLFSRVHSVH